MEAPSSSGVFGARNEGEGCWLDGTTSTNTLQFLYPPLLPIDVPNDKSRGWLPLPNDLILDSKAN